ncbi:hypothetical protein MLD38_037647 [Melastoma candidum]|uniref:Uncharacterized protein n=1 Tax=Melastoma candidum TaxID=119954 RepID=A0ACB9LMQ0_9MYRT|nr:hypothetical protein MLD38_037647 [Melastoma candidum]
MVAIKVLDLRTRAASKSFMAECKALRNIRHRNLVKIFTACSTVDFQGNDFKALVYEYMENGSLEGWLHNKAAVDGVDQKLSLMHRLSIAIDIACAVEYLHHDCETPIIHCDLKPNNVLLDAERTAHVGDFGLARILSTEEVIQQASSVGVRGTIGYSPPEYGMGSQVSREGDVYSYGILLLEMFTGKRPTDDMFEDAWNIRSYCEASLPERAAEIADPCLFSNEMGEGSGIRAPRRMRECLVKVLEVGIGCCRESPGERMDIREAAVKLRSIKASGG